MSKISLKIIELKKKLKWKPKNGIKKPFNAIFL